jgi:hypothetical protein
MKKPKWIKKLQKTLKKVTKPKTLLKAAAVGLGVVGLYTTIKTIAGAVKTTAVKAPKTIKQAVTGVYQAETYDVDSGTVVYGKRRTLWQVITGKG